MAVDLIHEVWQELKRHINTSDLSEAADSLINLLIDNDIDAEEIKIAFKGDPDIKRALAEYIEDIDDDINEDYDDDY